MNKRDIMVHHCMELKLVRLCGLLKVLLNVSKVIGVCQLVVIQCGQRIHKIFLKQMERYIFNFKLREYM